MVVWLVKKKSVEKSKASRKRMSLMEAWILAYATRCDLQGFWSSHFTRGLVCSSELHPTSVIAREPIELLYIFRFRPDTRFSLLRFLTSAASGPPAILINKYRRTATCTRHGVSDITTQELCELEKLPELASDSWVWLRSNRKVWPVERFDTIYLAPHPPSPHTSSVEMLCLRVIGRVDMTMDAADHEYQRQVKYGRKDLPYRVEPVLRRNSGLRRSRRYTSVRGQSESLQIRTFSV